MKKTPLIWFFLASAALIIFIALGWMTKRQIAAERSSQQRAANADLQDRTRLALSRLDSTLGSLLITENQRPPQHYQPFYSPANLYTTAYQDLPLSTESKLLQPSPLLLSNFDPDHFIHLHFTFDQSAKKLTSPQAHPAPRQKLPADQLHSFSKYIQNTQLSPFIQKSVNISRIDSSYRQLDSSLPKRSRPAHHRTNSSPQPRRHRRNSLCR